MDNRNGNYERNVGRYERDGEQQRQGQGYRGQGGPGRGNQDYGPHGAVPYGSGPVEEPIYDRGGSRGYAQGRDYQDRQERGYQSRDYESGEGWNEGRNFQGRNYEGRDYTSSGAFGDRNYGGRGAGYGDMRYADDPNQGWGRGAAQHRQGSGYRGTSPKGWQRSDERLSDDICARLTDDDDIDASEISIKCSSGKVTLTGSVPDRRMKHRAEDLVESCSGVNDIDNRLTVNRGEQSSRDTEAGNGQSTRGKAGSGRS